MIWRLRKKFIKIASLCFVGVFLVLFLAILIVSNFQTNATMDELTDLIAKNDGRIPAPGKQHPSGQFPHRLDGINPETPFSTRFFTVTLRSEGGKETFLSANMTSIASVTADEAKQFARAALASGRERGWVSHYRYKVVNDGEKTTVVFVDGITQRSAAGNFLYISLLVFLGGSLFTLLLIVLISKKAVRPAAESYEKQKQFITDANHELKTPLTLILTNLDIAEEELGKNEWLDDIRAESEQMSRLVKQLVNLTRMDEETTALTLHPFALSETVAESAAIFRASAEKKGLAYTALIAPDVTFTGDEDAIRQLLAILLDNAVKYCDAGGDIALALKGKHKPIITVENSFADVGKTALDRLFDRFYRADKARTHGEGFGIGLSIAAAIAEKHHADLSVQNIGGDRIRFTLKL